MKHTTAATTRRALASLAGRKRKRQKAAALTDLHALLVQALSKPKQKEHE